MTRELIERVIAIGGSFYLPYRLHARPDQLARAYPAIEAFAACKRRYDPRCFSATRSGTNGSTNQARRRVDARAGNVDGSSHCFLSCGGPFKIDAETEFGQRMPVE